MVQFWWTLVTIIECCNTNKAILTSFLIHLSKEANRKSCQGYRYGQLFVSDSNVVYTVLMVIIKKFILALKEFGRENEGPSELILGAAGEYGLNKVQQFAKEYSMRLRLLAEST